MKKLLILIWISCMATIVVSQEKVGSISVQVSADTLYEGNVIGVKYIIENIAGDFQPPEFGEMTLVGGPNVSSSFSMVNGEVSQMASYEYILRPEDLGDFVLDAAQVVTGEQNYESDRVHVVVVDNPDGVIQDYRSYKEGRIISSAIPINKKKLTKEDSLKMKLRHLKSKKI